MRAANKIDSSGKRVFGIGADVSIESDIKKLFAFVQKKFGRVDVLVNNAGVFWPFGPFEKCVFSENRKTIEINLLGTMLCSSYAVPLMKKRKWGRIINISGGGVGGDIPLSFATSYFTSKGGVAFFTEGLAVEVEKFGITVNAFLPGQILTEATRRLTKVSQKLLGSELITAVKDLKKNGGSSTSDVADWVSFLISPKGDKITGRLISVRWDKKESFKNRVSDERFKLRRIEGKIYKKVNK